MAIRLEHANLSVRDYDGMVRFLQAAFPDFRVRREGRRHGHRWLHIGMDHTYIALNEATSEASDRWVPYSGKPGVNHLGYEVDDADGVRERLAAAGFHDSTVPNEHPHRKRVYFFDPDGNDWEFVQYYTDEPALRNDYDLPDA